MPESSIHATVLQPVFLVTGPPGAGKTSVSIALAKRFARGLHVPVDDVRAWVVSGNAAPVPDWTVETSRQFALARIGAVQTALAYHRAGFAVAIDDIILPAEADRMLVKHLPGKHLHKILLLPDVEVVLERNCRRHDKAFDLELLADFIPKSCHAFATQPFARTSWYIIDSSGLNIDETVDAVLRDCGTDVLPPGGV